MRISDWSSDVCSSDLALHLRLRRGELGISINKPRCRLRPVLDTELCEYLPQIHFHACLGKLTCCGDHFVGITLGHQRDNLALQIAENGWLQRDRKSTRLNSSH